MALFDFAIGNPPYQDETTNEGDRKPPIYHLFMESAYNLATTVELITPARFLFNAGQTPKSWNEKMLTDPYVQVMHYEPDATTVFPNTDIKGGIVITLRNTQKPYGPIGTFTQYNELNDIIKTVAIKTKKTEKMDTIVSARGCYRLTLQYFNDYPEASKKVGAGSGNMIVSNIFEKVPEAFQESCGESPNRYIKILGRINNARAYRYIKKEYIVENEYVGAYKVILPEANGSGKFGETLSGPMIGDKWLGATDTFLSVGKFESKREAAALLSYMKTKFFRTLLFVKKATQHTPKSVWTLIPLQDFTTNSDIDWSQSVEGIDRQLYKKYNLTQEEIDFIESHVKEMV